ncbi:MAG TPA: rhodanese-like domain-containing protein [Solirubrobacteraceae bacterium]|nr:rhodanese-like domain-containing protein [Solirubrobacteraceae bacterium]
MTAAEARAAVDAGALVLDLRAPRVFARGHVPGAITMQFNRADLADRAELVLPADRPLVVHAEPEPIARVAAELLAGAGFDVAGHLEGGLAAWRDAGLATAVLPLLDVDELHAALDEHLVVDVREGFEYRHGHVPGAVLLPSGEAWERMGELPADRPLAVVCGDQTRSAAVASMLLHAGRDARLVMGGMVDWVERGLPVEHEPAAV